MTPKMPRTRQDRRSSKGAGPHDATIRSSENHVLSGDSPSLAPGGDARGGLAVTAAGKLRPPPLLLDFDGVDSVSTTKRRRVEEGGVYSNDDDDNGNCGDPSTRAQKPAPGNKQDDNAFQWLNNSSDPLPRRNSPSPSSRSSVVGPLATSNSPSPSPRSSLTGIPIFKPTSFKSCCINMPKQSNELSRRRSTLLTNNITSEILPTEDDSEFWDNLQEIETISHNQDVRGEEDGQKKPFPKYIAFTLNGEVVMKVPPDSDEVGVVIKSVFPIYKNSSTQALCTNFRRYWSPGGRYHGHEWNGFCLEAVEDILWYSDIGFAGDSEERVRAHAARRMEALNTSTHFSGFIGQDYNTGDIERLKTIVPVQILPRLRNSSAQEMSLFNHLAQASRQLTPDSSSRSRSNGHTGLFSRNDTQESASYQDCLSCFSTALAATDLSVYAFVAVSKGDMQRISMWSDVNALKDRRLENINFYIQDQTINLVALFPDVKGEKARLEYELVTLATILRRVFSAKSLEELRDLIIGIYWYAMKIRQEYAALQFVNDYFESAPQDISSKILEFATTDEVPTSPICVRHGCNNIAALHPDPAKRGKSKYDHETCNEPACANRCAWHVNGRRCNRPTKAKGRFCAGSSGTYCTNLDTRNKSAFVGEMRRRVGAGEKFG